MKWRVFFFVLFTDEVDILLSQGWSLIGRERFDSYERNMRTADDSVFWSAISISAPSLNPFGLSLYLVTMETTIVSLQIFAFVPSVWWCSFMHYQTILSINISCALLIYTQGGLFYVPTIFIPVVCCFYYVTMETIVAGLHENTNGQCNKRGETIPFGIQYRLFNAIKLVVASSV